MPDEGSAHSRTWMAFGASAEIWGADLLEQVRSDLAAVARAIARHEPVTALVRPHERDLAHDYLGSKVTLLDAPLDDLWIRDSGPTFVTGRTGVAAVDFNFNGWGDKQAHTADAAVAARVASAAGCPRHRSELVLEGGALEVDGHGTAIITESCVLNDNRNPGWSRTDVEAELADTLGIDHVIWLPGIAGQDITDGHTDFYARFVRPGVVVAARDDDPASFDHDVTRRHLRILTDARDRAGRRLQVAELPAPRDLRPEILTDDFAAGYVNFYVCNGAVIAPRFGDARADAAAAATLQRLYPDRQVAQVRIDGIAAGGGGIHCSTQQQPHA
nr:agmatine deiminase family protein [Kineosporia sp. A_224]